MLWIPSLPQKLKIIEKRADLGLQRNKKRGTMSNMAITLIAADEYCPSLH